MRRLLPRLFATAGCTLAMVACLQDFDAFEPVEGADASSPTASDAAARDSGVADAARSDAADGSTVVDCTTKKPCYDTGRACKTACTSTRDTCITDCGGNNGCRNRCRDAANTCDKACEDTCDTCAGPGCTPACN